MPTTGASDVACALRIAAAMDDPGRHDLLRIAALRVHATLDDRAGAPAMFDVVADHDQPMAVRVAAAQVLGTIGARDQAMALRALAVGAERRLAEACLRAAERIAAADQRDS